MPHSPQNQATPDPGPRPETVDLLDGLEIVLKQKRFIVSATAVAFFLSVAATLLMPNIYSSTALILPPQQSSGVMGLMMGQLPGGMAGLAGDLLGKGTPSDLYARMLSSQAVSDAIIERFKLMEVYRKDLRADTYEALARRVDISVGKKDGVVSITVSDKEPKRAAEMANAYVDELDRLSARLGITDAGNDRSYLETNLAKAKADLVRAEENLKGFQSRNRALDLVEQTRGTIKGLGELEGQLSVEEVKLAGMRRNFTDGSPDVQNQQAVVSSLRAQIAKFEGERSGSALPGVGSVPELGQQYLRLMREFKIQETLVEFLTKQYEIAKLSQAKDIAGVQVIQKATVPDRKEKPRRSRIVLFCTFAAGFLAVLTAFSREAAVRLSQQDRERLARVRSLLQWKRKPC
ncbi:MAG: hypothetical protein A2075_02700 [Geobacteraceae bacterium GWC2_58_44]|nr:MAG: hypothetical protein A2075_02700 [Geobacteraceae bacterium GWC2_58_44]HBG05174.1 lipopolysaccharide biosynthesis protein [Geobacter sp.]